MRDVCVRVLSLCAVVLSVAAPAFAQTPGLEVSGGYQFLNFDVEDENESLGKGWYLDVAGNVTPMLGVVFQVGGNYRSLDQSITVGAGTLSSNVDVSVHQFLGGVRVNARGNSTLVPYAQVLAGGINGSVDVTTTSTIPGVPSVSDETSATEFALELGGGVNFGLTPAVGIRVGGDYIRLFADDQGANLFRFHIGVVFKR
jgi:opacity protein-like surface antigen